MRWAGGCGGAGMSVLKRVGRGRFVVGGRLQFDCSLSAFLRGGGGGKIGESVGACTRELLGKGRGASRGTARRDIDHEGLGVVWNINGREKKVGGGVNAPRWAVCRVVFTGDISGMDGDLVGGEEIVYTPEDEVDLVVSALPVSPAFHNSLVVSVDAEMLSGMGGGA